MGMKKTRYCFHMMCGEIIYTPFTDMPKDLMALSNNPSIQDECNLFRVIDGDGDSVLALIFLRHVAYITIEEEEE